MLFGSTLSSFSSRPQMHFYPETLMTGKDTVQCVDTMLFTITFL